MHRTSLPRAFRSTVIGLIASTALAACASGPRVPYCASIERLSPLPVREECQGRELEELERRLSQRIAKEAGSLLVRLEFDRASLLGSACVERSPTAGAWAARFDLAPVVEEMRADPAGPKCIAERRVDLNRYEATLAKALQLQRRCADQMAGENPPNRTELPGREFERFEECLESQADWIALHGFGAPRPLLFAKPEISDPPKVRAQETTSRCSRIARRGLRSQIRCIEADGWELLR